MPLRTGCESSAFFANLIEAANKVCGNTSRKSPALVILKKKTAEQEAYNSAVS